MGNMFILIIVLWMVIHLYLIMIQLVCVLIYKIKEVLKYRMFD